MAERKQLWSSSDVKTITHEIRTFIQEKKLAGREKIDSLLIEIDRASQSPADAREALRRFLLILFVLNEHVHGTRLKEKSLKTLTKIAEATLRIYGVAPKKSRLDFLYEDFHLILSQLYNNKGNALRGAWEQVLAMRCGGDPPLKSLAVGSSALRLGHGAVALKLFNDIAAEALPPQRQEQLLLKKCLAVRLSGRIEEAKRLQSEAMARTDLSDATRVELEWEALCLGAQTEQKILPLLRSVRRGERHHGLAYGVEAFLWSRAVSSQEWITQFAHLRTLLYNSAMKLPPKAPLVITAKTFEALYSSKFDLDYRLRALGELFPQRASLGNVQQEALLLAAGLRWLLRVQASVAIELWRAEYGALSSRLTDGKSRDLFHVFE